MYLVLIMAILLTLTACSNNPSIELDNYYKRQNIDSPTPRRFIHCHGYGCKQKITISLNNTDWQRVQTLFQAPAANAEMERETIRNAIGEFEKIIGPLAGTDGDVRGSFLKLGRQQHDCVDESINTTTYMTILQLNGLIVHHDILPPSHRFLRNGLPSWPHQTATLKERESGAKFAVDSWFRNNGYPPFIVPIKTWRLGWQPAKTDLPEVFGH